MLAWMTRRCLFVTAGSLAAIAAGTLVLFAAQGAAERDAAARAAEQEASEQAQAAYDDVLGQFVDADGLVDYAGLKARRAKLDRYVDHLARFDAGVYAGYEDGDKIAFWINAYNALTLRVIIDRYPIKPSKVKSLVYPKESIRQIPGVWEVIKFTVMGKPLSLNSIEHEILRVEFSEPRIHMAIVCASIGCPPLRAESFSGKELDGQLDDQVRRFLATDRHFKIDRERDVVHLSSIFDWFGDDFAGAGEEVDFAYAQDKKKSEVLEFVLEYVAPGDRRYIIENKYDVAYLPYDWSLNVQRQESERGGKQ